VVNARGDFVYSAYDPIPRVNIADRYHFQRHLDAPRAGLVISPPLLARTTGKWSVVLTRRISFEDERFAGVVNAVLDLEYLQTLYRSLQLGPHGTVVLRDTELRLLARYPSSEQHMGRLIPGHHAAPYVGRGLKHGVYRARGQVDGIERLYSFRQVGDLPLVVFAGIAEEDYLAEWRQHVVSYSIAAGVFSLVVIGLVLLSWLGATQREEAEEALRKSEARLNEAQHIAHIGSWELDLADNALTWSNEIFHMFEIDREKFDASYDAFLNAIHPDDREQVNRAYTESVANVIGLELFMVIVFEEVLI
jgi:PAS domain-containing protein